MRALGGPQGVHPVCLGQLRIDPAQRGQMLGDRGRVAAGDRAGERGLATLQRVLQRRPGQRPDDAFGDAAGLVVDGLLPEQFAAAQRGAQRLERVGDDRHDVVARVGQRGVVEDAGVLADTERLPAHLQHQRLRDRIADLVGRGDAEAGVGQPADVLVGAGERHRRVNRQRDAAVLGQWRQDADPVGAGGVRHDGPGPHRRRGGQPRHQAGEFAVGNRQQQQLSAGGDVRRRSTGVSGSRRCARCRDACGDGAARHHDVVGALQRHTERGAYPAGGDDPHLEPGRAQTVELHHRRRPHMMSSFVPVPHRGTGRSLRL